MLVFPLRVEYLTRPALSLLDRCLLSAPDWTGPTAGQEGSSVRTVQLILADRNRTAALSKAGPDGRLMTRGGHPGPLLSVTASRAIAAETQKFR